MVEEQDFCHSIAKINTWAFFSWTVFQVLNIIWLPEIWWPWKYGSRSCCITIAWRHSMAYINLYKSRTWEFFTSSHLLIRCCIFMYFQNLCDLENVGRYGALRQLVSTSIKVVLYYVSLALTNFQILNIIQFPEMLWLWKYIKVMMHNIHNGTIQWKIPDFLSDGNGNEINVTIMFALSHFAR